jgi:hypothetical protein
MLGNSIWTIVAALLLVVAIRVTAEMLRRRG